MVIGIDIDDTICSTNERIIASLEYIVNEIKNGECDYDAINLSLSSRITSPRKCAKGPILQFLPILFLPVK